MEKSFDFSSLQQSNENFHFDPSELKKPEVKEEIPEDLLFPVAIVPKKKKFWSKKKKALAIGIGAAAAVFTVGYALQEDSVPKHEGELAGYGVVYRESSQGNTMIVTKGSSKYTFTDSAEYTALDWKSLAEPAPTFLERVVINDGKKTFVYEHPELAKEGTIDGKHVENIFTLANAKYNELRNLVRIELQKDYMSERKKLEENFLK